MNNMNHDFPSPSRIVWLDVVRLTAMLMVIGVHCIDPFYISPTLAANQSRCAIFPVEPPS